ncbi:MAG: YceI family protein [Burkholderiales bacterium]
MIGVAGAERHSRVRWAAALALLAACVTWAQPVAYRIDPARTQAEFEVEHLGVFKAHGRFGNVSGSVAFDASSRSGAIDLAIPVASVATGWDARDAFLRGASMFDAQRFPRIRFASTRFAFDEGRLVRVEGELTLRDVTRPVALLVRTMRCEGGACNAEAAAVIRRREFGMEAWWPLIDDEVTLQLRLVATRE